MHALFLTSYCQDNTVANSIQQMSTLLESSMHPLWEVLVLDPCMH